MNTIAVILPVYKNDNPKWISLSVSSILNQSWSSIKVFIGIDGPIGSELYKTLSIIGHDDRVCLIQFNENRGLACVLNDLIDVCLKDGYEYIARMDADDISRGNRFELQMNYLEEHPEIDVIGGAINEIDEDGNDRGKIIIYPETPVECMAFFSKRNPHAHPAVLFRKSFFEKLNWKKYRPEYRQNQDTMLWYDGLMAGTQHANVKEVVLDFRITNTMFKKRRNGWAFAKKQFKDRLMINRGLGYGWKADVYGFAMFCMLVSPVWVKKFAYKVFR